MGKGSNAAKSAEAPNDEYDQLSESAQQLWDQIGALGFTPDKTDDGKWVALSQHDDTKIGPCESLSVLSGEVLRHVGELSSDEIEIYEDAKGPRLPGIPLVADQQIVTAAGKFKAISNEWSDKGKERKTALDELKAICNAKPHLFKPDPNNSNAKIYHAGGMTIRIKNDMKQKVEVDLDESEDDD